MLQKSPSPESSPLAVGEDLAPLPTYKKPSTITIDFTPLLEPSLKLREDLSSGCGGQLWPAGMVLARHMLRYHKHNLRDARILELGAGGGLVGLSVALGCGPTQPIYISDQQNMLALMEQNIIMNALESRVMPLVLDWGGPLPQVVLNAKPNIILAADCVYFEPAFPLLLRTLVELLDLCEEATVLFSFKKRRRADMQFMRIARKVLTVAEVEDQDRSIFSMENLFLYQMRRKK